MQNLIKRSFRLFLLVLVFLSLLSPNEIIPQVYQEWVQTITKGSGKAIAVDSKFNVIVAGTVISDSSKNDFCISRYDPTGKVIWTRTYNGLSSGDDIPYRVAVDYQRNIIVTGKSYNDNTDFDFVTIKYDSNGVQKWINKWSSEGKYRDVSNLLCVDQQGDIYIAGYSGWDYQPTGPDRMIFIKYDADGNVIWSNQFVGPGNWLDYPEDMFLDNAGYLYVAGRSWSSITSYDFTTLKFSSDGSLLWEHKYDQKSIYDVGQTITVDQYGNVYSAGFTMKADLGVPDPNISPANDIYMNKLDYNGNLLWSNTYNGTGDRFDETIDIDVDENQNVFVLGKTTSISGNFDWTLLKYDINGTLVWKQDFNGAGNGDDYPVALHIYKNYNGKYDIYASGYSMGEGTDFDFITIKYNDDGGVTGIARYNGFDNSKDVLYDMMVDKSGKVYATGESLGGSDSTTMITVKYSMLNLQEYYNLNPVFNLSSLSAATDIAFKDNYAFVIGQWYLSGRYDSCYYLQVLDISNPKDVKVIDTLKNKIALIGNYSPTNITIDGHYAYINFVIGGIRILDINDPTQIIEKSIFEPGEDRWYNAMCVSGDYLYLGDNTKFKVINISNPENPYLIGTLDIGGCGISDIKINGNYAYVINCGELAILDISNPAYPVIISNFSPSISNHSFNKCDYKNDVLYLSGYSYYQNSYGFTFIEAISVSDPNNPLFLSRAYSSVTSSGVKGIIVKDDYAYTLTDFEVKLFDIRDNQNICEVGFYRKNGGGLGSLKFNNDFLYALKYSDLTVLQNSILFPATDVKDNTYQPGQFSLSQNYPNPFNPETKINYSLPERSLVTLKIFDILGKVVATLVNEERPAGNFTVSFNANNADRNLPSGVYFYRLQAGNYVATKKLMLIK
jgi:hypothetical protein